MEVSYFTTIFVQCNNYISIINSINVEPVPDGVEPLPDGVELVPDGCGVVVQGIQVESSTLNAGSGSPSETSL